MWGFLIGLYLAMIIYPRSSTRSFKSGDNAATTEKAWRE